MRMSFLAPVAFNFGVLNLVTFIQGTHRFIIIGLLLAVSTLPVSALAVDCTPNDITLSSQADVDNFQADHGPCDRVVGTLTISGADIANVAALSGLVAVNWLKIYFNPVLNDTSGLASVVDLSILDIRGNDILTNVNGLGGDPILFGALLLNDNPNLSDLSGLSGLISIGASLAIDNNDALVNLDALSSLTNISASLNILRNDSLQSISGLSGVAGFSAALYISENPQLLSLNGINGVTSLNGLVLNSNDLLTNVDELLGLEEIGNTFADLLIANNPSLTNLDGLADLISVNADVEIADNAMLAECMALSPLMDQVDDGFPGPGPGGAGIPDIAGDVTLMNNLMGCNTVEEIVGDGPPPLFELVPVFAGLGTDIGVHSVVNPGFVCEWEPGESVEIRWDDPDVPLGMFVVDEDGCFQGMVNLNDDEQLAGSLPGVHQVSAVGSMSGTSTKMFEQMVPELNLTPPNGPPRLEVMASGCNWEPGAPVMVSLEEGPPLDVFTADGSGCFSGMLRTPDEEDGFYVYLAESFEGPPTAAAYWIQTGQAILTPPEGPPDTPVPLSGCNWFPEEVIEFAFTYNNVVFDSAGSNQAGCIDVPGPTEPELYIPDWAVPGAHTIRATGQSSNQRIKVPFSVVERSLEFDPPNGLPDDLVHVSGCGWVGNTSVDIEWGFPDPNNQPIIWEAPVNPANGCFGITDPFPINIPENTITGLLTQTATGDVIGETSADFIVWHGGTITLANPNAAVGQTVTVQVQDAIVGEAISFFWAFSLEEYFLNAVGVTTPNFSVDITLPNKASVGIEFIHARSTRGFFDSAQVNILDTSEIEVVTTGDIPAGTVVQVEGRNWSATEAIAFRLRQGPETWGASSFRVPAGQTEFSTGVILPVGVPAGGYMLEADGDLGRLAQTPITLIEGPAPDFGLAAAYATAPPVLDGVLMPDEWDYGQKFDLDNGFITVLSDDSRLYVLLDMLDDTTGDSPDADAFWLTFDLLNPNQIDAGWDLNYLLDGSGELVLDEYTGPNSFAPRNSAFLRSAYAAGFGCFAADGSKTLDESGAVPVEDCDQHRVFEIGIDLGEIMAQPGDLLRVGLRTVSQNPAFDDEYPSGFAADFTNLGTVLLAPSQLGPSPPAGALLGIGSNGFELEVTQATQDADNSLNLVADKATVARVYPDVAGESLLRTYLFGRRGGADLPGSPMVILSVVPSPIDRGDFAHTPNFLLPASWISQGITELTVVVQHPVSLAEQAHAESFLFQERHVPTYWVIPINAGSPMSPSLPSGELILRQESSLEVLYPVSDVDWVRRGWEDIGPNAPSGSNDPDLPMVNSLLNDFYDAQLIAWTQTVATAGIEPFTFPDQIYGFTIDGGGLSNPVWGTGAGYVSSGFFGTSGDITMAHEINHNLDRGAEGTWGKHTTDEDNDTSDPDWGCSAKRGNTDWPRTNDEIGEVGFDTRRPWKLSGQPDITVLPDNWPDYMSYCISENESNGEDGQLPRKWTSEYRWGHQFSALFPPPPRRGTTIPEPVYYISGELHVGGTGSLAPVKIMPGSPSQDIAPGDYSIEIQDAGGSPLLTQSFYADFEPQEEVPVETVYFNFKLPFQPAGEKVVLKHLGMVLDMIEASSNPPTIEITLPEGGEIWDGVGDIEWTAEDLDADDLTFSLMYSPDGGLRWYPIAHGLTGTEYQVNTWRLPAGMFGRIMLVATDGFHTVTDETTEPFEVPATAPEVIIERPANGQVFRPSDLIELRGRASLPQSGADGLQYAWYLDGAFLESGRATDIQLEDGLHQILLKAWDEEGNLGEASVQVEVALNDAPNAPAQPAPADNETNVLLVVNLDWVGGDMDGDPITYDVYLEAGNPAPSALVCNDSPLSQCAPPGPLLPNTQYYWQVIASDDQGLMTPGPVWHFMTEDAPPADLIHRDGFETAVIP